MDAVSACIIVIQYTHSDLPPVYIQKKMFNTTFEIAVIRK